MEDNDEFDWCDEESEYHSWHRGGAQNDYAFLATNTCEENCFLKPNWTSVLPLIRASPPPIMEVPAPALLPIVEVPAPLVLELPAPRVLELPTPPLLRAPPSSPSLVRRSGDLPDLSEPLPKRRRTQNDNIGDMSDSD